jgi:hypothetical protein
MADPSFDFVAFVAFLIFITVEKSLSDGYSAIRYSNNRGPGMEIMCFANTTQ